MRYHGHYPEYGLRYFHQFDEVPLPEFASLVHVGEMVCDRGRTLPEHRHDGFEICYVARGHLFRTSSDGKHTIRPGEFYISQPGEGHGGGTDPAHPCHYYAMSFDISKIRQGSLFDLGWRDALDSGGTGGRLLPSIDGLLESRIVPGGQGADAIFRRMLSELESQHQLDLLSRNLSTAMIQAQVLEVLLLLMKCQQAIRVPSTSTIAVPRRPAFRELMHWLTSRLCSPPTLTEMADRAGLTPAHFSTAFKRDLGMSPMQALRHLRISEAARRLAVADHSVQHIAIALGFESSQYFSYAFRKQFGCTPTEYRLRHRKQ